MCKYCQFGGRGKFKGRTPDFLILQDRFAVKIEKDEPYVGDYGLTVSDNEDECEFTVAINFCPVCGRKLTNQTTAQQGKGKQLTLSLKRKWFDMIKSGIKKEEYRECSDHWIRRFVKDFKIMSAFRFEMCFRAGKFLTDNLVSDVQDCLNCLDFDKLVFTLGYPKAGDTERRLEFKNPRIRIGMGKPEWGAEPGKLYFVITWEE